MTPPPRPDPAAAAPLEGPVGALLGRPDLSDAALLVAIEERLAMDGRTGIDAEIVLEAARLRKRKAIAFLRKLVLPPPSCALAMPVRPILRSQHRRMAAEPITEV